LPGSRQPLLCFQNVQNGSESFYRVRTCRVIALFLS
jgi:hypothetical protein